jgi:DNA-binding YbaB/EbfC family protein
MKLDMKSIMKQAERLQEELKKKQDELAKQTFEATSGGGMVTAKVSGKNEVLSIKIDKSIVSPSDVEMLEDLVVAATNEALKRASDAAQGLLSGMMGGMGGPGGMGSL